MIQAHIRAYRSFYSFLTTRCWGKGLLEVARVGMRMWANSFVRIEHREWASSGSRSMISVKSRRFKNKFWLSKLWIEIWNRFLPMTDGRSGNGLCHHMLVMSRFSWHPLPVTLTLSFAACQLFQIGSWFENVSAQVQWTDVRVQSVHHSFQGQDEFCHITLQEKERKILKASSSGWVGRQQQRHSRPVKSTLFSSKFFGVGDRLAGYYSFLAKVTYLHVISLLRDCFDKPWENIRQHPRCDWHPESPAKKVRRNDNMWPER